MRTLFLITTLVAVSLLLGAAALPARKGQASVLKDGELYANVEEVYSLDGKENLGKKISANKSYNEIKLDGKTVGHFTFDKSGNDAKPNAGNLVITLTEDAEVTIWWECSKYAAKAVLSGAGVYSIPQIMQDNGKTQSFNSIWITSVSEIGTVDPPKDVRVVYWRAPNGDRVLRVTISGESNVSGKISIGGFAMKVLDGKAMAPVNAFQVDRGENFLLDVGGTQYTGTIE